MAEMVGCVYMADTRCVDCATADLGAEAIERIRRGIGAPSSSDYGASSAADWPRDEEGHPITALFEFDREGWWPQGCACGACGTTIFAASPA
jgi:hypothetical protein